jgi:hypothetical protein
VRAIARTLNRFGSVVISPGGIEFDGDDVAWTEVTEIRVRRLVGYLLTDAVTTGVDRLPIWWFPGRRLVLRTVTHTALTVVALAADLHLDRGVFTLYIPADVRSRGLLRSKQISPGLPAALVLADPAVRDCLEATAQAHGVPVLMADSRAGVLGAAHAGRVGATRGVVLRTLEAMLAAGARTADVSVLLGPAVSGANYEVPEAMAADVEAGPPPPPPASAGRSRRG